MEKKTHKFNEEMTAKLIQLFKEGKSAGAVAKELGVNKSSASRLGKKLGVYTPPTTHQVTKEEEAKVLEMRSRGIRLEDILKATGLKNSTARWILSQNKVRLTTEQKSDLTAIHSKEIKQKVAELRQQGMTRKEIAAQTGLKPFNVKNILHGLGIVIPAEQRQKNAYEAKITNNPNAMNEMRTYLTPEVIKRRTASTIKAYESPELRASQGKKSREWWESLSDAEKNEYLAKRTTALKASEGYQKHQQNMKDGHGSKNFKSITILEEEGFGSFEERMVSFAKEKNGFFVGPYEGAFTKTNFKCSEGHEFSMRPNNVQQGQWCPDCAVSGPSEAQIELYNYVVSLLPNEEIILSDRTAIAPLELDIYIPSRRFGIEYDGIFHHSEFRSTSGRHIKKARACQQKNVKLLAVFSDEWDSKKELIKSMIRWRLNVFSGKTLRAEDLILKRLDKNVQFEAFFDRNHLDGHAKASYAYGLFDGTKLISCMSIRTNFNKETEIARFATDYEYKVHGSAARLLRAVMTELEAGDRLFSFSNNRLSKGNVYEKLGFHLVSETPPSYWYTDGKERIWRFRCKRNNDPAILSKYPTEKDQAANGVFSEEIFGDRRPLFRIEDYGHMKWAIIAK